MWCVCVCVGVWEFLPMRTLPLPVYWYSVLILGLWPLPFSFRVTFKGSAKVQAASVFCIDVGKDFYAILCSILKPPLRPYWPLLADKMHPRPTTKAKPWSKRSRWPKTRPGTLQAPGPLQASILVPLDINLDFRRRFDRLLGAYWFSHHISKFFVSYSDFIILRNLEDIKKANSLTLSAVAEIAALLRFGYIYKHIQLTWMYVCVFVCACILNLEGNLSVYIYMISAE